MLLVTLLCTDVGHHFNNMTSFCSKVFIQVFKCSVYGDKKKNHLVLFRIKNGVFVKFCVQCSYNVNCVASSHRSYVYVFLIFRTCL